MWFVGDNQKTHSGRLKKLLAVLHEARVVRGGEVITSPRVFFEVGLADVHIATDQERALKFPNNNDHDAASLPFMARHDMGAPAFYVPLSG